MPELLPLTRFEQYIFHMDCPSHPWIVHARLQFQGIIERSILEEAIAIALKKHPLLQSIIVEKQSRLFWKHLKDFEPQVELLHSEDFDVYPDFAMMDMEKCPGLRVFLKRANLQSAVFVQWHHLCGDAQGMNSFLEDVFVAYDGLCSDWETPHSPLDFSKLGDRDECRLPLAKRCFLVLGQLPGLIATGLLLFRRFHHLTSPKNPGRGVAVQRPNVCHRSLDSVVFTRLVIAAREFGVTLNDLMLRELIFAFGKWKAVHGFTDGDSWLRIAVPISLRGSDETIRSMRNRISIVVLQRRQKTSLQYERLLGLISDEMNFIKKRKLGYTLRLLLKWASFFPRGIRCFARSELSSSSTVFSNVGRVFDDCALADASGELCLGPARLIQVDLLTVVSYPQVAACSVCYYAGRLNFSMSYQSSSLSEEQAAEIMDLFVGGLSLLAENHSTESTESDRGNAD